MYWIARSRAFGIMEYYLGGGRWTDLAINARTYDYEEVQAILAGIGGSAYVVQAS